MLEIIKKYIIEKRFEDAEKLLVSQLLNNSGEAAYWTLLAISQAAQSKHKDSLNSFKNAYLIESDNYAYVENYAVSLTINNELEESLKLLLNIKKNYRKASVYLNIANIYKYRNELLKIELILNEGLKIFPNNKELLKMLAEYFFKVEKHLLAIDIYEKMINENIYDGVTINNIAKSHEILGNFNKAKEYLIYGVKNCNEYIAEMSANLSSILIKERNYNDAAEVIEAALKFFPKDINLNMNYAEIKNNLGKNHVALEIVNKILIENGNNNQLIINKAKYLQDLGHTEQSEIILNDINLSRVNNFEFALIKNNLGELNVSCGDVIRAIENFKSSIVLDEKLYIAYSNLLFSLNYHPSLSAEDIYSYYSEYDQKHCNFEKFFKYNCDILKNRKIKIGYVSPDFKKHSMRHFLLPLIQGHDKSKFELHAYAELINEDEFTLDYKRSFDHWTVTTDMSDDALAIKIHDDSIDILIDCAGHTKGNRLFVFARKPAPISISMLGYGYTTGLKSIDYFLCNKVLVPDDAEKYFSESPLRIDGPWAVYRPDPDMPEVSELPALKNGYITFCTLTRAVRINELVIEVWSEILKRCENSKLRIDSSSFTSNKMKEEFYSKFEKMGIDKNRLTIGFNTPAASVLSEVDITLDCFPHNSGTTLYESLYMGVPFITLASRPSVGLIGSSILDAMNRQEWIGKNFNEYINKTLYLAEDIIKLSKIRISLRNEVNNYLMDELKYVKEVEDAYCFVVKKIKNE